MLVIVIQVSEHTACARLSSGRSYASARAFLELTYLAWTVCQALFTDFLI